MINNEVLRKQNQKHQFVHSCILYATIVLATLSILLIIAIYIIRGNKISMQKELISYRYTMRLIKYRTLNSRLCKSFRGHNIYTVTKLKYIIKEKKIQKVNSEQKKKNFIII